MRETEFKDLFNMHFDAIRRYIYYRCSDSELASDIAQDLFTKIWEKNKQINPLKDKALLYKMASDMLVSRMRRKKIEINYTNSVIIEKSSDLPDRDINIAQLKTSYIDALSEMTDNTRITYLMSRDEDMKYHEIADIMGISVKAVEKRMSAALVILRRKLLN
ncbi:MAG: sigma-70 family RNA polymerase sigma factor [Bacteroidales bacterium]